MKDLNELQAEAYDEAIKKLEKAIKTAITSGKKYLAIDSNKIYEDELGGAGYLYKQVDDKLIIDL